MKKPDEKVEVSILVVLFRRIGAILE